MDLGEEKESLSLNQPRAPPGFLARLGVRVLL